MLVKGHGLDAQVVSHPKCAAIVQIKAAWGADPRLGATPLAFLLAHQGPWALLRLSINRRKSTKIDLFFVTSASNVAQHPQLMRMTLVSLILVLLAITQCAGLDQPSGTTNSLHLYNECVRQLNAPRVALLFLVREELLHRELWRQWLLSASGIAPMAALVQSASRQPGDMEHAADHIISACLNATAANTFAVRRQYLFSVHLHVGPEVPFDPDAQLGGELLHEDERIPTNWAGTNLVDATRRLLQRALQVQRGSVRHRHVHHHPHRIRSTAFSCCSANTPSPSTPPWWSTSSSSTATPAQSTHALGQTAKHPTWKGAGQHAYNDPWLSVSTLHPCRFDERFSGLFDRSLWRKSCQFVGLLRSHAEVVASETTLWKVYEEACPGSTPCFADEVRIECSA